MILFKTLTGNIFNFFVAEAIICATWRESCKLQNNFLKVLRLFELHSGISRLFHSINVEEKKIFLKKFKQSMLLDDLMIQELDYKGSKL